MSTWRKLGVGLIAPLAAIFFALIISSVALAVFGHSPLEAYKKMIDFTLLDSENRQRSLSAILNRGAPYYLIGLAAAIGFKMNLFNIGIIGSFQFASLIAAWFGAWWVIPAPFHPFAICVVAVVVGAGISFIPAILKVKRGINEVLSTIMLNAIVPPAIAYLLRNYFRLKKEGQLQAATEPLGKSAKVPLLNNWIESLGVDLGKNVQFHGFVIPAIFIGIAFYILVFRTRFGFDLRSSGVNPSAASASGVNPSRMIIITMLLSGALAGLAAMAFLLADPAQGKYGDAFPGAFVGVNGLAIALVGRNHPGGVAIGALLFSFLERATVPLPELGIPSEINQIMKGSFLLGVVLGYELVRRWLQQSAIRAAAARSTQTSAGTSSVTAAATGASS
jgi:general nucleoside transport system permease protein